MAKKKAARKHQGKKLPASTTKKAAKGGKRVRWLDDKSGAVLIDGYARQLGSFLSAVADGRVDDSEIKSQEARLVKLMKAVEPNLDDELHAKVTELLCELTAYDLMQVMNSISKARPKTVFRG